MKIEQVGQTPITRERPLLILEAGVNHEGSLERALEMVDAAAESGGDLIKFQSYKAETLASRDSPAYWDRSQEPASSQFELFGRYDGFGDDEYRELALHCAKRSIGFLSTPFDSHFVELLAPLMPAFKVASADLTNDLLLRQVASHAKPVLLSVGASYLSEIDAAVRVLQTAGAPAIGLLHCVLQYPTQAQNAHLAAIGHLQRVFPEATVGWSDHVPPRYECLSLLLAWMAGADILEKHFTLDKTLPGNDHYHAMDPDDVRDFRARQQAAVELMGRAEKTVLECEEPARKFARRSLVAAAPIAAGTPLTAEMFVAKRPGTGISPRDAERLLGAAPLRDIGVDEILQWDMFLSLPHNAGR